MPANESVSLFDRGLQYGHGAFETCVIAEGAPLFFQYHLDRLQKALRVLDIPFDSEGFVQHLRVFLGGLSQRESGSACINLSRTDYLRQPTTTVFNSSLNGILKIVVTAGDGERGYASPSSFQPLVFLIWLPQKVLKIRAPIAYTNLWVCDTRLAVQPRLAGLKHLNRLEQVMAANELQGWLRCHANTGVEEGLLREQSLVPGSIGSDYYVEAISANLFIVESFLQSADDKAPKWRLVTPPTDRCGVAGVIRKIVIEEARKLGHEVLIELVDRHRLVGARACFITSSGIGIRAVNSIYEGDSVEKLVDYHDFYSSSKVSDQQIDYTKDEYRSYRGEVNGDKLFQGLWKALQSRIDQSILIQQKDPFTGYHQPTK